MDDDNKKKKTTKRQNLIVTSFFANTGKSAQHIIEDYILREASNLL